MPLHATLGGVPPTFVITGTVHFSEASGILKRELKLQVKTHRGTPTTLPPCLGSLLVLIPVSVPHCVSLSPSLSTCVEEVRTEYKSTIHHSRK